jgi:hypothetical protein
MSPQHQAYSLLLSTRCPVSSHRSFLLVSLVTRTNYRAFNSSSQLESLTPSLFPCVFSRLPLLVLPLAFLLLGKLWTCYVPYVKMKLGSVWVYRIQWYFRMTAFCILNQSMLPFMGVVEYSTTNPSFINRFLSLGFRGGSLFPTRGNLGSFDIRNPLL